MSTYVELFTGMNLWKFIRKKIQCCALRGAKMDFCTLGAFFQLYCMLFTHKTYQYDTQSLLINSNHSDNISDFEGVSVVVLYGMIQPWTLGVGCVDCKTGW